MSFDQARDLLGVGLKAFFRFWGLSFEGILFGVAPMDI